MFSQFQKLKLSISHKWLVRFRVIFFFQMLRVNLLNIFDFFYRFFKNCEKLFSVLGNIANDFFFIFYLSVETGAEFVFGTYICRAPVYRNACRFSKSIELQIKYFIIFILQQDRLIIQILHLRIEIFYIYNTY